MSPKEVRTIRQSNVPLQSFIDRDQLEGTSYFEQTVSPPGQVSMVSAVMEILNTYTKMYVLPFLMRIISAQFSRKSFAIRQEAKGFPRLPRALAIVAS